jgi:hypothetical protein
MNLNSFYNDTTEIYIGAIIKLGKISKAMEEAIIK